MEKYEDIIIFIKEKRVADEEATDFLLKTRTLDELKHLINLYQISDLKHLKKIKTIKWMQFIEGTAYTSTISSDYDVERLNADDIIVVTFFDWLDGGTNFIFPIKKYKKYEKYEFQFEEKREMTTETLVTYINLLKEALEYKLPHTRVTIRFQKNGRKILTDKDVKKIKEGDILNLEFFFVLFFFFRYTKKSWEDITDKNEKNLVFFKEKPTTIKDFHGPFEDKFGNEAFLKYFISIPFPKFTVKYKDKYLIYFNYFKAIRNLLASRTALKSESILILDKPKKKKKKFN